MVRETTQQNGYNGCKNSEKKKEDRFIPIVAEDSNLRRLRRRRVGLVNKQRKTRRRAHSGKEPNCKPILHPKFSAATLYLKKTTRQSSTMAQKVVINSSKKDPHRVHSSDVPGDISACPEGVPASKQTQESSKCSLLRPLVLKFGNSKTKKITIPRSLVATGMSICHT